MKTKTTLMFVEQEMAPPIFKEILNFTQGKTDSLPYSLHTVTNINDFSDSLLEGSFNSILTVTHSRTCEMVMEKPINGFTHYTNLHFEEKITLKVLNSKRQEVSNPQHFSHRLFSNNLETVLNNVFHYNNEIITLKTVNGPIVNIKISAIAYMQSQAENNTLVHTLSGECFKIRLSQRKILSKLPDFFKKIHRLYSVNVRNVQFIENNKAHLKGGHIVPMGPKMQNVLRFFLKF